MNRYNPSEIEPKWQQIWHDDGRYAAADAGDKPKYYVSGMFPYPSGAGMHTGHFFEHSIVDAVARFRRALGYNVMYPMGWDAFGLPAENYAIKTGVSPQQATHDNIANFKNQLNRVGASIDWSREVNTSDPEYYRWTQWVFLQLFKRGLAYQKEANQWWCPKDKTVLANEQVIDGKCWRCGTPVIKKSMKQWFFKITDYAEELLDEIPNLDWPEKIKIAQTNWIGKSVGAEIDFTIADRDDIITVFSTRPDTIFGATFLVLAPEHPLAKKLTNSDTADAVTDYIDQAIKKSEIERSSEDKEKTGIFTGSYAINPADGEKIPIYVADYVLWGYGTGAVMAVPAHDGRDFDFATKYQLPIKQVIARYAESSNDFDAPRENIDTLMRPVVDAIISDGKGNYLLETENADHVHFVGGGIDATDATEEEAIRREIIEEVGFTTVTSIKPVTSYGSTLSFRETKGKNQKTWGRAYEVVVDPTVQVKSEIETGRHSIMWVPKDQVADLITWMGHRNFWREYLSEDNPEIITSEGTLVNSGNFDGESSSEVREKIVAWLEQQGVGRAKTTYKMRDWLISRQRYWGAPIPIIHCPEHGAVAVPEKDLPVLLPKIDDYAPKGDGKSPLAREETWVNTTCPECGRPAKRETDVMDGYACSSWYLLRYTDPHNNNQAWSPEKAKYWEPIDMYVGGDHAVAHLLYVRFWNHVFYDLKLVPTKEPIGKLVYHGLIQAEDGRKMSKSLGNVVDPLDIIDQGYGADALRTFELFLGPVNENSSWSSRGIAGVYRFLNRVWTLTQEYLDYLHSSADFSDTASRPTLVPSSILEHLTHQTIKKVTDDINRLSFNTAIAALMEYVNELYKLKVDGMDDSWRFSIEALLQMIQPFAPHIAAELWQQIGHDSELDFVDWPSYDETKLVADKITVVVQVNGKLRAKLSVDTDATEDQVKEMALDDESVKKYVGSEPKKIVYVKGRLLNIVL